MKTKIRPYDRIEVEFDEGYLYVFGEQKAKQLGMESRLCFGKWIGEGPRNEFFPYMITLKDLRKAKYHGKPTINVVNLYTIVHRTKERGLKIINVPSEGTKNFLSRAKLSKWEFKTLEAFL